MTLRQPTASLEAGGAGHRPLATFLTQIVASAAGAPAYRRRRRAEPGEAEARYRAAQSAPGSHPLRRLEKRL